MELPFDVLEAEYKEKLAGRLVADNDLLGITGELEDYFENEDETINEEVLNDVFGGDTIDEKNIGDVFGSTDDGEPSPPVKNTPSGFDRPGQASTSNPGAFSNKLNRQTLGPAGTGPAAGSNNEQKKSLGSKKKISKKTDPIQRD